MEATFYLIVAFLAGCFVFYRMGKKHIRSLQISNAQWKEAQRKEWEKKLPPDAKEKGIFSPFSDIGNHKGWKCIKQDPNAYYFRCDECGAIIHWLPSGLFQVIDGHFECPGGAA